MFDEETNIIDSIRNEIKQEIPTLSQQKEQLRNELTDPEIALYRNFRHLSLSQLDTFNADTGLLEIPDQAEEPTIRKKVVPMGASIGSLTTSGLFL